ncbi:hypothetical protein [Methanospirillum sp.]|uniref:hypothetical protein n=1 Tax=Methanospirillum sp. TaxID=45200 RepID=UPI001BD3494C|nr:hypothetical protein [Methanospirillum sp.]
MKETGCKAADKSHECTCQEHKEESDTSSGPGDVIFNRKKLLEISSRLIEETHERISGDRFRVREGDKERLQYLRALTGLIALHTSLLEKARAPDLKALEAMYRTDPIDTLFDEDIAKLARGIIP